MPDFDKNLNPFILNKESSLPDIPLFSTADPAIFNPYTQNNLGGKGNVDPFFGNGFVGSELSPTVTAKELHDNRRYDVYEKGIVDIEDQSAYAQSGLKQAYNGVLKGVNLAATTIAGGFGMLTGAGQSIMTGRMADIWDNPIMQALDEWNKEVDQNYLPNYYTNRETESEWYSTDNWVTTNFLFDKLIKNSGYAVGAMISGNIANGALGALGSSAGAATASLAGAAESSAAFRMFTPLLRNTARVFSTAQNVEAATILSRQATSLAEITAQSSELANIARGAAALSKINTTARRTLMAAYSSAGESSFEALQTANEYREKLINDYKASTGTEPDQEALNRINQEAELVGKTSFLGNIALLSVTEYLQLPYLMGSSYRKSKEMANSLIGKTDDIAFREGKFALAADVPTGFGKLYQGAKRLGTYIFDPKEAGQEIGQYALQVGTQNYFDKAYRGEEASIIVDGALYGLFGDEVGALTSKEGIEGGIIGGITGGLMQAKGKYSEKASINSNTKHLLTELNSTPSFKEAFIEKMESVNRGVVLQKQREDAIIQGDQLEATDIKTDLMHNYLATRIKYGKFDLILDDIAELKKDSSTQEGLDGLKVANLGNVSDTVQDFHNKLEEIEKTARFIQQTYDDINVLYGGQVATDDNGTPYRRYTPVAIDKLVYAATKIADYDKRIPQLNSRLLALGVDPSMELAEALQKEDSTGIVEMMKAIDLEESINKTEKKLLIKDLFELALRRKQFIGEYNDVIDNPEKHTSKPDLTYSKDNVVLEDDEEPKETMKIKTKDGDKDIEIGTEYFLGRVIDQSKGGQPVNRMPIITVVGKNEDGTIKVKTGEGEEFDVNESIFRKYKLARLKDTLADKKAKFVLDNWNIVYMHKGLKVNGQPARGRIEYYDKEGFLLFTYVDEKGKLRRVPVANTQFNPAEGYAKAMIVPMEKLTAAQAQSYEDIFNLKETPGAMARAATEMRNEFLVSFYEDAVERLAKIDKSLKSNRETLASLVQQIEQDTAFTKAGKPRKKLIGQSRRLINSLINQKTALELSNIALQSEKEELEQAIPIFETFVTELTESDATSEQLVSKLKEDVDNLEDLINFTSNEIEQNKSLLKQIGEVLDKALEYLNDFIRLLRKENPNVPLFIEEYQTNLERYMSEEAAQQVINDRTGFTEQTLELESSINDFSEELEIPSMEKESGKLVATIQQLEAKLDKAISEQIAKKALLDKFEAFVEQERQQRILEDKLTKDGKLKRELLGTADKKTIQTADTPDTYESNSRKDKTIIPVATITTGDKPHAIRSNTFGFNYDKMPNKKFIKGVQVTTKTQDQLIPGLIEHLVQNEDGTSVSTDGVIALVMVEVDPSTGAIVPVDERGRPILNPDNYIDSGIYQMYPEAKLSWSSTRGGESMFRSSVSPEEQEEIRAKYARWRESMLANENLPAPVNVEASFGIIQRDDIVADNGDVTPDYDARHAVTETGFVTEEQLLANPVIFIPKNNNVAIKGTVSYEAPFGVPFLDMPNGYVKLNNRRLLTSEVDSLYQAILQYCKYGFDPNVGPKNPKSKRLLTYLQSIVYWGIPTDQSGARKDMIGYNSVFFDTEQGSGRIILRIGREAIYDYTPYSIEENKDAIIADLKQLYNNINSYMAKDIEEKYEQIISIKDEEIKSVIWPNYQTFLLSNKNPDGTTREGENIPLTTNARILQDPQDVNREGIYFYTPDTITEFDVVVPKKTADAVLTAGKLESSTNTEPSPTKKNNAKSKLLAEIKTRKSNDSENAAMYDAHIASIEKSEVVPEGEFIADGASIHVYTSGTGKKIAYLIKDAPAVGNEDETIVVLGVLDAFEVLEQMVTNNGLSQEEAKSAIRRVLANEVLTNGPTFTAEDFEYSYNAASEEVYDSPSVSDALRDALKSAEVTTNPRSVSIDNIINSQLEEEEDEELTRVVLDEAKDVTSENWPAIESWLKANFSNVPVFRVKNVIKATNGRQAWGMFKDGAIYVYEKAEVGTTYHEVFHGVWRMFSDEKEQTAVLNEFKKRSGTFFDRESNTDIKYSEATDRQAEEALAEEFRDYVQNGKIPSKPKEGRSFIVKMFYDLVNFIKKFFLGNTPINTLFENINQGKYKSAIPYSSSLEQVFTGIEDIDIAEGDENTAFSLIGITDGQRNDIIQEMTYQTLATIIKNDESLFTVSDKNKKQLYDELYLKLQTLLAKKINSANKLLQNPEYQSPEMQEGIQNVITIRRELMENVLKEWDSIVSRHEEYLKSYGIEFDENDAIQLNEEDKIKESDKYDSTKIDTFKKASPAVKLLLSTLPVINTNGKAKRSSIGGVKLMPISQVYISIMNNVHSAQNIDDMLARLKDMAINDPNYELLYRRLTKSSINDPRGINYQAITTTHGAKLLDAFWKTFKKQNPKVMNVLIFENGDIAVGNANLSNSAEQLKGEYLSAITQNVKQKNSYFEYDQKNQQYSVNKTRINSIPVNNYPFAVKFLNNLGINYTDKDVARMNNKQKQVFLEVVGGIKNSLLGLKPIKYVSGRVLNIDKNLFTLGLLKSALDNPEFDSTYFNISNERTQSYIGTNAASDLYTFMDQLENFNEDSVKDSPYQYLNTDVFAQGSNIMERKFDAQGNPKEYGKELFSVGYAGGTINQQKNKQKQSASLTYKERLVQELNLNIEGWYMNLIPGDASLEWMLNMGNPISEASVSRGLDDTYEIFRKYFISEMNLSREERPIANVKGRKTTDLRFFKPILGEKLHDKLVASTVTPEEIYEANKPAIDKAIKNFIEEKKNNYISVLKLYGIYTYTDTEVKLENINFANGTEEEIDLKLTANTINYMIANIEMHKLLYADPYQYKDELKRIKSFNSPRQAVMNGSTDMNALYDKVWNRGYEPTDSGYTFFGRDAFKTVAYNDIEGVIDLPGYDGYTETDGSGIISAKGYRELRIRSGEWNDSEEYQYRYDVAWEKRDKGIPLSESETQMLTHPNPAIQSAYTPLKPIVSGNKGNGNIYNDIVLDKFALYPLSYRVLSKLDKKSNARKLYDKMQTEGIDYIVFDSGRKVGNVPNANLYNDNGEFNETPYTSEQVVTVPFSILGIQSDVPSKEAAKVTRGSQVTKLITMDFMEAGVPVDYAPGDDFNTRMLAWYSLSEEAKLNQSELYKEIKNNQMLLEAMMELGLENLMKTLGIEKQNNRYVIVDFTEATNTLRNEIFKREVNDNISQALSSFLNGGAVLESTPAYQQIRNILYSIADREIISPKISGGMKVQIPSTLLESVRAKETEINGKKGYTSDYLKFYEDEDGKRVCEIMVGRWFKSSLSDNQLLDYLNNTPEGQSILSGLAFRIPTQKQNSIDAFKIKQFLPKEFGDSVVIPAALVAKVGSDFDIDKLSVYLKNTYPDGKGRPKLVPYLGIGKQAKEKFEEMFDRGEFLSKEQHKQLQEEIDLFNSGEYEGRLIEAIFGTLGTFTENDLIEDFVNDISLKGIKQATVDTMYKKSLENAFIQSGENLVTNPYNFQRLIMPNSADRLKSLAKVVAEKTIGRSFDYTDVSNMLGKGFMSRLRHAFVAGKRAIGIAAVSQTNHSLNQRQPVYIDKSKLSKLSLEEQSWLGNGDIKFQKFNKIMINGKPVPTLSMIKAADGTDISDVNGQFIDGYVDISKGPWIMELGATPNVASTWLFLVKLGVPIETVAYFMNQPLVREYLRRIENAGYSYLFIDTFLEEITDGVLGDIKMTKENFYDARNQFKIPADATLLSMLGADYAKLPAVQKQMQLHMLYEFVKYAKMAEQLFNVTQGSNFDTANFNDPYLIFKKYKQLEKAQNSIIASVDSIMDNSFLGNLGKTILEMREALSTILLSDQTRVRNVIQKVIEPYVNMSDRDFVKLAQKAVNDLFDWTIQTSPRQKLNSFLHALLINREFTDNLNSFVKEVKKVVNHPLHDNLVIDLIEIIPPSQLTGNRPYNIKIKNKDNKVYDQNNVIYAFREMRNFLKGEGKEALYNNLVALSVVQSGLSNSPISFTSLLPQEDIEKIYNEVLGKLNGLEGIEDFYELGVFQRNNWNNDDIVPMTKAVTIFFKDAYSDRKRRVYNPSMEYLPENIKDAISDGTIPQITTQSTLSNAGKSEYIVFTWEKQAELLTAKEIEEAKGIQYGIDKAITAKKKEMRAKGDYSFIQKGLFKKVRDQYGDPLITSNPKKTREYFVYKAMNAWGDSYRANEFYNVDKPSVFDNGFIKVNDVHDDTIIDLYLNNQGPKSDKGISLDSPLGKFKSKNSLSLQINTDLTTEDFKC